MSKSSPLFSRLEIGACGHGTLYSPLNDSKAEIRLLKLHPRVEGNDSIECTLFKASLNESQCITYFALSYVWGDAGITETILVNGHLFPATKNLVAFLRQCREFGQSLPGQLEMPFWVDAICINQANIPERNSQVLLMGSIYSKASLVVSWLGEEKDQGSMAVRLFATVAKEISKSTAGGDNIGWLKGYKDLLCSALSLDREPTGSYGWDAIAKILDRPYWSRAWILQEITLPEKVMIICGQQTCFLEDIFILYKWLKSIELQDRPSFVNIRIWTHLISSFHVKQIMNFGRVTWLITLREYAKTKQQRDMIGWRIVPAAEGTRATDPRDKIYSLLGLSNFEIIPDYSKPVKEVYCEFAKATMEQHGLLIILYSGIGVHIDSGRRMSDLPSWVPDGNALSFGSARYLGQGSNAGGLTLQGSSRPFSVQGDILSAPGIICDDISDVEPEIEPSNIFSFCSRFLFRTQNKYPTGIPQFQALIRFFASEMDGIQDFGTNPGDRSFVSIGLLLLHAILILDSLNWKELLDKTLPEIGLPSGKDFMRTFHSLFLGLGNFEEENIPRQSAEEIFSQTNPALAAPLASSIGHSLIGRTVFHTKEGYIGHGTTGTRPGDLVCVLFGCDAPLVLRQIDSHYINIGSGFVVGLMEGQAVEDLKDGAREARHFQIW